MKLINVVVLSVFVGGVCFPAFAQVVDEDYLLARSLSLTLADHQYCDGARLATKVNDNYTVKQAIEQLGKSKKIDSFQERFMHRQFFLSRALFSKAALEVVACFLENGANPWINVLPKGKKPEERRHIVVHAMRSSLPYKYLDLFFEAKFRPYVFPNGFFQAQGILEQALLDYPSIKNQKMRHVIALMRIWAQSEKVSWDAPSAFRKILPMQERPLAKKNMKRLIEYMKRNSGFGLQDQVAQAKKQGGETVRDLIDTLEATGDLYNPSAIISDVTFSGFLALAVRRMASKELIEYLLQKGLPVHYLNAHTSKESHIIWVPIFFAGKEAMLFLLMSKDMRGLLFPNGVSEAQKLVEQYKREDHGASVFNRIQMFEALVSLWAQEESVVAVADSNESIGLVDEQEEAFSPDGAMAIEDDDDSNTSDSSLGSDISGVCHQPVQVMDLDEEVDEDLFASAIDPGNEQNASDDSDQVQDEDVVACDFVESTQAFFDRDLWKDFSHNEIGVVHPPAAAASSADEFSFGSTKEFLGELIFPDKGFEEGAPHVGCDFWKVSF